MRELDNMRAITQNLQLQKFDLEFLKEEIVVPSLADTRAKYVPSFCKVSLIDLIYYIVS